MLYREEKYLNAALKLLERWIPSPPAVMIEKWKGQSEEEADWNVEEAAGGLVFCIFGWPETDSERCVLLVYDEQMRVIADASAVHCSVSALLGSSKLYDELSEESDWMYLEHYTLCCYMFPQYEYPPCKENRQYQEAGEALLFSSVYVTESYRRRGIFTVMIQMMRDFALRRSSGNTELYSAVSLDPDIAVYGPDAKDEPYYYSFEKDEPVRKLNAMILEKAGFDVLRLEETEEDPKADGTKLWFAVKKENDLIVDVQEKQIQKN